MLGMILLALIVMIVVILWQGEVMSSRLEMLIELQVRSREQHEEDVWRRVETILEAPMPGHDRTLGEALADAARDLRTMKRRLFYLQGIWGSIRRIETPAETETEGGNADSDPGRLPTNRLASLLKIGGWMPLSDELEKEKEMLLALMENWRREADNDEFDTGL